ncbi:MAG: hypothetical protein ACXVBW_11850, partial [Bdellovibrionota bacterium]
AIFGGFDSNALLTPSGATVTLASGQPTGELLARGGIGLSTSPLNKVQWVPSYRTSFNYNTNSVTQAADFYSHVLSLYANVDPMAPLSYGFKVEGNYLLDVTISSTLSSYLFLLSTGPYVRWDVAPQWTIGAEADYQPQMFFQDSVGAYARAGNEVVFRAYAKYQAGQRFWNPTFGVIYDLNYTNGTEFRSHALGASFSNTFHPTGKLRILGGLALADAWYPWRPEGPRNDPQVSANVSLSYEMLSWLVLLAESNFTINASNVSEIYQYSRLYALGGVGFQF